MLFIFALPVMQVILFCLAIGRDPTGLHLAIVNNEMNYTTMECPIHSNCTQKHFSCIYLNSLPNETIIQVRLKIFLYSLPEKENIFMLLILKIS